MNSKKRGFCAIFGHFEVPRDGFNSNRIRKIAFISKRLAEKFCCTVKVLQFLPNLKGQVVWSLLFDVWGGLGHSPPCGCICRKRSDMSISSEVPDLTTSFYVFSPFLIFRGNSFALILMPAVTLLEQT